MKILQLLSPPLFLFLLLLTFSCKKDKKEDIPRKVVRIAEKDYKTLKIGSQIWTVVNYSGPGGIGYNEMNSKPEYGKYYTFDEIKGIQLPEGWRIPSMKDYIELAELQGVVFEQLRATNQEAIRKLTSKTNWKNIPGNNLSGFDAYPGGYSFNNSPPIDGDISEFWMADGNTISIQEGANLKSLRISFYNNSSSPEYRFNLRFIKDN